MQNKRLAIIGTAGSWALTPWTDPALQCWSLNDAYRIAGFQRADAWFDFHPPNKWHFIPPGAQQILAHQIPVGHYVRPAEHLAWLAKQTIPVYLHHSYRETLPEAASWPHARAFPKQEIEAQFGRYFTSSPAWMLALAMYQGCRDISIYGIHLATEHEYIEQRPQFEFLIGRLLGPSKLSMTVKEGMRHYETADGHCALPEASPVLQSDFQYAYEPRPRAHLEPLKWEQHKLQVKMLRAMTALKTRHWWQPVGDLQDELWLLEARMADVQDQMQRASAPAMR